MNKYKIRFNKNRGKINQGSINHVWRIFENDREILAKYVVIRVPSWSEIDKNGHDYNIVCCGHLIWYEDTDTVVIIN